ncbi:hypothetical protein [Sulfidibacter corallicola]
MPENRRVDPHPLKICATFPGNPLLISRLTSGHHLRDPALEPKRSGASQIL